MNRNTLLACATAKSLSPEAKHWRQGTVTWGEIIGWTDAPASYRECGSYVLGTLRPGDPCASCAAKGRTDCLQRNARTVVSRSALVLDADHPSTDLLDRWDLVFPHAYVAHTTYNSAPDAPRYRIIIPTDREMAPDEYFAVAQTVMALVGAEQWDPSCNQAARFMFKPSAQEPGWFQRWVVDGDPLPVDDYLQDYDPDLGSRDFPAPHRNKRDPFSLDGVIGAFNRAYTDTDELIEAYDLPYEPAGVDRWQLVGARSAAGMGKMGEGLWFSHHANDPAVGRACSAFDLVRLHRFGELDAGVPAQTPINRLPSYTAMQDLAADDHRVTAELVGADFSELEDDVSTASWRLDLKLHRKTGIPEDIIQNWDLIRENDPVFAGLIYNEFSLAVECTQDLPWRPLTRGGVTFNSADRAALCHYIEREYKVRPGRWLVDELVATTAQQRYHNPVRDYLDGLRWDGTERLETCLPGVTPTAFTRMVARKVLVAAVARIYEPGCKWDHTLVLQGDEGLGKSWWVDKMARGYSAPLVGKLNDKDTLITMQRSWIMVADEGFSLKKADSDVMKEFLTRREDVFRLPYDREAQPHPRHTVIWASINDEVFLRNQQGNRRFLIVRCEQKVDFDAITDDYIAQVWAEAVHLYRAGERLFLASDEGEVAAAEREQFTEEDALVGVIQEYLDTLVPDEWDTMSPEARQIWLANRADGTVAAGTRRIERVCSAQIWVEALGNRVGNHRRTDLLEINTALKHVGGWVALPGRHRLPAYGPQLVFGRTAGPASNPPRREDLL